MLSHEGAKFADTADANSMRKSGAQVPVARQLRISRSLLRAPWIAERYPDSP